MTAPTPAPEATATDTSTDIPTMHVLADGSVALSAGRYYIGDPCYPFPNTGPDSNLWGLLLRSCGFFDANATEAHERQYGPWTGTPGPVGHVTVQGRTYPVLGFSTAHGDGSYPGSDGFDYGVDAGLLGMVPMALVEVLNRDYTDEWLAGVGTIVTFEEGFFASETPDATLTFGHVVIKTDDDAEEDEHCFRCGEAMPYGYCESRACDDADGADETDED